MKDLCLYELIDKFGDPDIIIDHYYDQLGYAIWGFDDIIYSESKVDFIELDKKLTQWSNCKNEISAIGFLNYNLKNYIYDHIRFKPNLNQVPLFWFVKPKKIFKYKIDDSKHKKQKNNLCHLSKDILDIKEYRKIINTIKKELYNGNVYQINMTMPKFYQLNLNSLLYYLEMRNVAKPKCGYYINLGGKQILSFSPETFFTIQNQNIKTYPMKGTIERSSNAIQDLVLKKNLENSKKDLAEHLMIVDLMRNDLGKICQFGTINVKDLFKVNSYETVHQMESCVSGLLEPNISFSNIIKALFPGGSVTGAPKESAMKIIDHLENYSRDIYSGSIGYIKNNSMNFNIAIRTMIIEDSLAKYPIGGGIVWDSDYQSEWNEAQLKSKIINHE